MSLLAPWALWFGAVALGVVALYLLKIKRRRETVPALDFWRRLAGQTQVRSLFRRLKRWMSLALWLLIVGLLILALGNPIFSLGRIKPQSIAIVLDNSASMQTRESVVDGKTETRWSAALAAIDDLTNGRPVSDRWLLIEAGRQPRVVVPWTLDAKALREAAAAIAPHSGAADLAGACELAGQLLVGHERPAIVVISDGASGEVARLAAKDERVIPWSVGKTADNLGITRLTVRAQRELNTHQAFISVANASDQKVETSLILEIDGSAVAVEPLAIEPRGVWEKTLPISRPAGGVLRARIDRADALPIDNEAWAILEPIKGAAICLVTNGDEAFFFEQALAAMEGLVDADASRTLTPAEYDAADPDSLKFNLTIFNNAVPKKLPASGAFVFVNQWPAEIPARVTGALENAEMTLVTRDHPLVRYVSTAAVNLSKAKRVELAAGSTPLARTADGSPLVFFHQSPDRSSLCLAFDVLDSDLPFRIAFPLLLRNAVGYLVTQDRAWIDDQYAVGAVVEPRRPVPDRVKQVAVERPKPGGVDRAELPVVAGAFSCDRTENIGPLRFQIGDETAYTAVNLSDPRETRIAPDVSSASPRDRLALSRRLMGAAPWLALAMSASLLVGLEWLTYHYRWTE